MHILVIVVDKYAETKHYHYLNSIAALGQLVQKLLSWGFVPNDEEVKKYYLVLEGEGEPVFVET